MRRWWTWCFVALAFPLATWPREAAGEETRLPCSESWYRRVDESLQTGDGQGHGPDLGSDEWKSVVEFRLGVRGQAGVPERSSEAWCRYVDELVRSRGAVPAEGGARGPGKSATGPSFDCSGVEASGIEATVCGDEELSALDRKLAGVYAAAAGKAANEHPPVLKAEQRGWIKGRDECWKSDDTRVCVRDAYVRRIAELQARYRLVSFTGPVWFTCDDNPANEVVATYFQTDPPTLIAERGDSVSFMVLQTSASGSRYEGRNETLWEHQGEASITWGYGSPEMHCKKAP